MGGMAMPMPCTDDLCGARPVVMQCFDGSMPDMTCGRNPETGLCEWSTDACPEPPQPQECDANRPCQDTDYCDYPDNAACGTNNTVGVCKKRPEACNDGLALVCGCDGQTYDNACTAQAAGVDVQADGECPCNADVDCRGDDRVCHENACIDRPQCPNKGHLQ